MKEKKSFIWHENQRPRCALAIMRYGEKVEGIEDPKFNYNHHAYYKLAKLHLVIQADGWYIIQMNIGKNRVRHISCGFLFKEEKKDAQG